MLPSIGSLPSPRAKKPWLPPSVTDLGPAKAPFQQFQNLSGMFAERDSELKELHEELDELLGGLGLDHLMQTPSPSPASPGSPEPVKPVNLNGISKKATKVWESPVVPTPAGVPAPVVPACGAGTCSGWPRSEWPGCPEPSMLGHELFARFAWTA